MICVIVAHTGYRYFFGFRYGLVAVESFFVISGFLIGEMLLKEFQTKFNLTDLKNFWIKRWFRTIPLYYFVIIVKFLVLKCSIGWNIIYYFLFLQNNFFGIGFLQISWTLVLEEWFYLIMPVIFYFLFKNGISKKKYYRFFIVFLILTNLLRLGWVLYTNRSFGAIVGNFPFRLDSFLIGVTLAAIKIFDYKLFEKMSRLKSFAVYFTLFIILLYFFRRDDFGNNNTSILWIRTIWFSLISISIATLLPYFVNSTFLNSNNDPIKLRWLITWLSLLSYPIYLIHVDIYLIFHNYFSGISQYHPLLQFLIKNAVVVILSLLLYNYVHSPVLRIRSKMYKNKN